MPRRKGNDKRERQSRPSLCVACGEAAMGYYYGAPSCNSCKTFFRRAVVANTSKVLKGECMKAGLCGNDGIRICRACRYHNCTEGGMNPLMISYNELEVNHEEDSPITQLESSSPSCSFANQAQSCESNDPVFIETRFYQESPIPCDPGQGCSRTPLESQLVLNPCPIECKVDRMIQNLLAMEEAHQMLRISSFTPPCDGDLSIDHFIHGPSRLGQKLDIMRSKPYLPQEIQLLPAEVLLKCRRVIDFTGYDYSTRKVWNFHDNVYAAEYIRAQPVCTQLGDKSKRVLLSSAMNCAYFTSAYFSYRHKSDRTLYPDGSTMKWSRELQEQSPQSTRFHTVLITAMREVDMDTKEYALLKSIVVCNPMLNGLSAADATLLRLERERCTKALLSYVLARRGVDKAPASFTKLLAIVNLLTQLTSWDKNQHILAASMGLYKNVCKFAEDCFTSS